MWTIFGEGDTVFVENYYGLILNTLCVIERRNEPLSRKNILTRTSLFLEKKNLDYAIPLRFEVTQYGWRNTDFPKNNILL